jgi:hypothetical protein
MTDAFLSRYGALVDENAQLRAENLKISCHRAALIKAMRDHGVSDHVLRQIAEEQLRARPTDLR